MATAVVSVCACVGTAVRTTQSAAPRTTLVGHQFRWAQIDPATGRIVRSGTMSNLPPGSTVRIDPKTGDVEGAAIPFPSVSPGSSLPSGSTVLLNPETGAVEKVSLPSANRG
jgi:hypothetical protein